MIGVAVLGATGTIGTNTLDVVARHPERFRVVALTAYRDDTAMRALCQRFNPEFVVMADPDAASRLQKQLQSDGCRTRVAAGAAALDDAATAANVDYVMAGIVGAAGLPSTLAAVKAGKRVMLANKEALVLAGSLFMRAAKTHGAELLPIDSEHNAVFQCMPAGYRCGNHPVGVERIVLTASGGPFRTWTTEQMSTATPEQAVNHPKWVMGRKISVDSATMMNKGLEAIEAAWLFDLRPEQIEIVVHPQSVIHSMVCYADGSVLAQLGEPDMRTPIAQALAWPERIASGVAAPDFTTLGALEFEAPDEQQFPCLRLAREAMIAGGVMPAALNAANEVAVEAFLDGAIPFGRIAAVIEQTLETVSNTYADDIDADPNSLDTLLSVDRLARQQAVAR